MAKGKFLASSAPEKTEPKTAAQLNDERQPAALQESQNINNRYNETDERPAIEQTFQHNEVHTTQHTGKSFQIDADFTKEMHARDRAERKARTKARKAQAQAKKTAAKEQTAQLASELKKPQSLDPDLIKEQNITATREKNLKQVYPDPVPSQSPVEEAIWQRRKEKGAQIAQRAKLEDIYDDALHHTIVKSFMFQAFGIALAAIAHICGDTLPSVMIMLSYAGAALGFIYGYIILKQGAQKYRHRDFPSDQAPTFQLSTIAPFLALRLAMTGVLMIVVGGFPIIGKPIAIAGSILVGSSLHYSFLAKYQIEPNLELVVINTVAFIIAIIVPDLISMLNSPARPEDYAAILTWSLSLIVFFVCDRAAAKLAPGHYSE